jgi:hypothetical protein
LVSFFREATLKMLTVLAIVMLASLCKARNIPHVPAVLHPPVPEEGKL